MSLLSLFSGPSLEKLEKKGDAHYAVGQWGKAKLAYEHAYQKAEKAPGQRLLRQQLAAKIIRTKEALAEQHLKEAEELVEGEYFAEARELMDLAAEITTKTGFANRIKERIQQIEALHSKQAAAELDDFVYIPEDEVNGQDPPNEASTEEYFEALCGPLPPEVYEAYRSYGPDFKTGYVALNQADFETAAHHLARALEQNRQQGSFIPLELASALINLGRSDQAEALLEEFLGHHPDTLPAYQLLCEVYWEQNDFEKAHRLLAAVPAEAAESLAFILLKGETMYQAGDYLGANKLYRDFFDTYGFNETIAAELAKTYEALGKNDHACAVYKDMMGHCNSCHTPIDPLVKHKYAELSFAAGVRSNDILELYLSLAQQIPSNAASYYDRISRIYQAQGNPHEATRFRAFSQKAGTRQD